MADQPKKNAVMGTSRERTIVDSEGRFIKKLEIPYTMDGANYSVLVEKEGSTSDSIEKAVISDATRIKDLKGKTLQI